MNWEDGMGMF